MVVGQQIGARLARLLRASSPAFARPDDGWAARVLPAPEFSVFMALDPRDREHGVRVARRLLERHPEADGRVVRAALLHDCGKAARPYNTLERVLVGLWAPRAPVPVGPARPSAAQVRRHHPGLGAGLVRAAGGDERVAELVERHHAPGADSEARLIFEADRLE